MAVIKLYSNTNADSPQQALVRNEIDPTPVAFPDAVKGDFNSYHLFLVAGDGTFDTDATADIASILGGVGTLGGTALASTTVWAVSAGGFLGAISYGGGSVSSALGTSDFLSAYFEMRLTYTSTSYAHTTFQAPHKIWNRVNT